MQRTTQTKVMITFAATACAGEGEMMTDGSDAEMWARSPCPIGTEPRHIRCSIREGPGARDARVAGTLFCVGYHVINVRSRRTLPGGNAGIGLGMRKRVRKGRKPERMRREGERERGKRKRKGKGE